MLLYTVTERAKDATNTDTVFSAQRGPNRAFGWFLLPINVKIGSLVYQRALAIIAAIDALAAELTGDHDYFYALGAGATKEQLHKMEEWARAGRTSSIEAMVLFAVSVLERRIVQGPPG